MERIEEVIQTACDACDISVERMLKCNSRRSTDAKMLVARFLSDIGYKHWEIAQLVSRTRPAITAALKQYQDRLIYDKEFKICHDKFQKEMFNEIVNR